MVEISLCLLAACASSAWLPREAKPVMALADGPRPGKSVKDGVSVVDLVKETLTTTPRDAESWTSRGIHHTEGLTLFCSECLETAEQFRCERCFS